LSFDGTASISSPVYSRQNSLALISIDATLGLSAGKKTSSDKLELAVLSWSFAYFLLTHPIHTGISRENSTASRPGSAMSGRGGVRLRSAPGGARRPRPMSIATTGMTASMYEERQKPSHVPRQKSCTLALYNFVYSGDGLILVSNLLSWTCGSYSITIL